MKSTRIVTLFGALALLAGAGVSAQQPPAAAAPNPAADLKVGPATIPPHWSKYDYPKSVGEGVAYHIIERGDTLWDLARRYLGNAYLWPQVWTQNPYVKDAHWIYPGDPLTIPAVALVSPGAGGPTDGSTGTPDDDGAGTGDDASKGDEPGSVLYPLTEETTQQCAHYVVSDREDEGLYVLGSEQGADKVALADRDVLYVNRGSNGGIKAGDVYSVHHVAYPVRHPATGKKLGFKVETTGWARVIVVNETSAALMVEQACEAISVGDYLRPFEKANVPLVLRRTPSDRLTPHSGKAGGYIVDLADNADIAGTNAMVTIDLGSQAGLAPGNLLTVYRVMYPAAQTPRNVVGELAVVSVRDTTATAKIVSARDTIMNGDQVELR